MWEVWAELPLVPDCGKTAGYYQRKHRQSFNVALLVAKPGDSKLLFKKWSLGPATVAQGLTADV